ncbi:hypothetical protein [Diaphorobacter caeni]|uniref:hypothetical protein n=1 Tax=Diaphorobacter caeni TaxID=2784387 RepID=UPI0018908494|nr:hypothetical protein [Diaphorobacter caeni]MBF5003350.1 hypothetical protein [Diaphorobacter caeni]
MTNDLPNIASKKSTVGTSEVRPMPPRSLVESPKKRDTRRSMSAPTASSLESVGPADVADDSQIDGSYFEAGDLDQSAAPVGDWYVLAELLPADISRIELRVWISATGALERWIVLHPENERIDASLEYLNRTILNPARRAGQSVASVMDVEILWGEQQPDAGTAGP